MAGGGWTLEAARDALLLAGYEIAEVLPIPHGQQIRCVGGQLVSIYAKGSFLAQGRDAALVKSLFAAGPDQSRIAAGQSDAPPAADPSLRSVHRTRQRVVTGTLPLEMSLAGTTLSEMSPVETPAAQTPSAGRTDVARRVTDYPSTRPEDAGSTPPW